MRRDRDQDELYNDAPCNINVDDLDKEQWMLFFVNDSPEEDRDGLDVVL